jgi:hypothetical protein
MSDQTEMSHDPHLPLSPAEVAHLTGGSWAAMAPGALIGMYCPGCDDVDALLVVESWYLDVPGGVVATGQCRACAYPTQVLYGILDLQLIDAVLSRRPLPPAER